MPKSANQPIIQSLLTGIELINTIMEQDRPLKFTEINELANMTKSNLHKYLNTLTMSGILFRDNEGSYFLGSKLIEFGNAAIGSVNLIDISAPYLKLISNKVKLTTLLSVWTNSGPVIANINSTRLGINIGAEVGTKLPVLSSAGKIYLAFANDALISEWYTPEINNLSDEQRLSLDEEIKTVRLEKFAFAKQPLIKQISSCSFPILNFNNDLVGCITTVGFTEQVPQKLTDSISQAILQEVNDLSATFGYQIP